MDATAQASKPIAPLNLSQPAVTNPQSGKGGPPPMPVSPVEIAKQRQSGNDAAAQQGVAIEQQQQMHDQQLAQQQEGFKQQQATQQAELAKQQAEQTMRQAESLRKQNEKALQQQQKTVQKQQDQVKQTQVGALKSVGNRVSSVAQRAQQISRNQGKMLGNIARLKMGHLFHKAAASDVGAVPIPTGPTPSKPSPVLQAPRTQAPQPAQAPQTPPQRPGVSPIFSVGTPSRSMAQIEGANHQTYNAQSAGLQRPGGATYRTPMGGTVSTQSSGRAPGIYENGVLVSGPQQAAQPAPAAPPVTATPTPVVTTSPTAQADAFMGSSAVAPSAAPAPAPAPAPTPAPTKEQTMSRLMEGATLPPVSPSPGLTDNYTMAQAATGDPLAMQQVTVDRGLDMSNVEPVTQPQELRDLVAQRGDPRRIPHMHDGIMDADLKGEDAMWAQDTLARRFLDNKGVGSYDDAADYFTEVYGDPELGQKMGERVWQLSNDRIREDEVAKKMEDYGMDAKWYQPGKRLAGWGSRLFDEVTGGDEVQMSNALFQRPKHFGSKILDTKGLEPSSPEYQARMDKRKENIEDQVSRMTESQDLQNRWLQRHRMDQDDSSTFARDFMGNLVADTRIPGDNHLSNIANNVLQNGVQNVGGVMGGVADMANADGFGNLLKQTGRTAWDASGLLGAPFMMYSPDQTLSQKMDAEAGVPSRKAAPAPIDPQEAPPPGSRADELTQWIQNNPEVLSMLLPLLQGMAPGGAGNTPNSTAAQYYSDPAFYGGQYSYP